MAYKRNGTTVEESPAVEGIDFHWTKGDEKKLDEAVMRRGVFMNPKKFGHRAYVMNRLRRSEETPDWMKEKRQLQNAINQQLRKAKQTPDAESERRRIATSPYD